MGNELEVTRHARERTRERLGLPKRAVDKNAQRALEQGLRHSDVKGSLNRYITALYFHNQAANNIRIWAGSVYLFSGTKLITVFPLPRKYLRAANAAARKGAEE